MYVGDSSNSPVEQMSVKKYSQTSNPNLLINTNFGLALTQKNQACCFILSDTQLNLTAEI